MLNQNPVIDAAMRAATAAVFATAASPTNSMSSSAVAGAQPELQANIATAIAADPVVQNATNTEPHWWMKRTFWSALASSGAAVSAGVFAALNYMSSHVTDNGSGTISIVTIGFALWAGYSAWRAGVATTPLGTPPPSNPVAYRG